MARIISALRRPPGCPSVWRWLPAKSGVICQHMGYVMASWNARHGAQYRGGSIYSGISQVDLDAAELRDWVSDDVELGRRVADDLVEAGRCPAGAFDRHAFEVLLRLFPDEDYSGLMGDGHLECRRERIRGLAAERLAVPGWGGRKGLCRDNSHKRIMHPTREKDSTIVRSGYHCPPPGGTPLEGRMTCWAAW
jgi:hypothetical protein